jgi:sugar lactone lactonase YvrE
MNSEVNSEVFGDALFVRTADITTTEADITTTHKMRSIRPIARLSKIEELPDTQHDQGDHTPNDCKADKLRHKDDDWNSYQREDHKKDEAEETSDRVHRKHPHV